MTTARPSRWALLFVTPFFLLGLAWVFTNPPGAAPDESDHLIKALAAARLEVGVPYVGPPTHDTPADIRNVSISRMVSVPAALVPDGFDCTAFKPNQSADCQPSTGTGAVGMRAVRTTVGAYPIFWYIPIGAAASLASTPAQAFQLGRLAALVFSTLLLYLAVWHLTRWLGRSAALGFTVALTPMAVFASAIVSTSGIEIGGAAVVAAVVVVLSRKAASLADPRTLAVLTVGAVSLVLSRQLGVVAFGVLALVALTRGGLRVLFGEIRRPNVAMIGAVAAIAASVGLLAVSEIRYDHPSNTGTVFSADAIGDFLDKSFGYVQSGVGLFGWLDTPLPAPFLALWVILTALLCGGALIVGARADRWTLAGWLAALIAVAFVVQAVVFTSVGAGLQGRHLLAIFVLGPMLAGVVISERVTDPAVRGRVFGTAGVLAGLLQAVALYANGRRYAVGLDGAIVFPGTARWSPPWGWGFWLALVALAGASLTVIVIRSGRMLTARAADPARGDEPATAAESARPGASVTQGGPTDVER